MTKKKKQEMQCWNNHLANMRGDLDTEFDYVDTSYGVIPIYEEPSNEKPTSSS